MNVEKLKALQAQVRIGGKGTARRKKKVVHRTATTDDKKLQSSLKKLSVNNIPGIEEVNMIKDDGTVIHFNNPKVQASLAANTFAVTGHGENKQITDLLPGILNQLGAESLTHLKKLASNVPTADGMDDPGNDADDDDDVPDLVENFDECCKNEAKETIEKVEEVVEEVVATPAEEIPAKAAAPVKTITCSTCVAKDPLSFVAFASEETLERHQVKVHGAEPSEKLKKIMDEEKKAEEDELDVMDMDDGGMDFGSDSEDEVVPIAIPNKPSIGAGKMAAIKANMAKAIEKPTAPEAKVEEVVAKVEELKVEEPTVDKVEDVVEDIVEKVIETVEEVPDKVEPVVEEVAQPVAAPVPEPVPEPETLPVVSEPVADKVEEVAEKVEEVIEKVAEIEIEVVDKVEEVVEKVDEVVEKVEEVVTKVDEVVEKVEEVVEKVEEVITKVEEDKAEKEE